MSEPFDPYYKWLGIPPSQQPATHYRLLGIETFEADREVIDAAANQRMTYLQDLAGGEHIKVTQALLNEVAAARRCLLNPAQKAAYDAALAAAARPAAQRPARRPEKKKKPAPRARSNRTTIYLAAGAALAVLLAAGGVGAVVLLSGGQHEPNKTTKAPAVAQATTPAKPRPAKTEPKPPSRTVPVAATKAAAQPAPPPSVPPPPGSAFHFAPKSAVLDELCEMLYLHERYHLFYVQHPAASPARRTWGHAVSLDLWNWQEEAEPFAAEPGGATDGGSVVLDSANTSGFGTAARPPLVAVYTDVLYRDAAGKRAGNTVGVAYSLDDGKTWTKFAQNPVLAEVKPGNKHPRVFWHKDTQRWCMVLFLGPAQPRSPDGRLAVFSSPNLREWTAQSEFDFPGGHDAPELCDLAANGQSGSRWCLLSRNGRYHFVDFDGKTVKFETRVELWDRGPHAVAPRLARLADGRPVLLGLLRLDGSPTTHQMLTPCLVRIANPPTGQPILRRSPIAEMSALRDARHAWDDVPLQPGVNLLAAVPPLEQFDIDLELEATSGDATCELQVRGLSIRFDARTKRVTVRDRDLPAAMTGNMFRLVLVVDNGSLEINTGDGMHTLALPLRSADHSPLTLTGSGARVASLRLMELRLPPPPD